MAAKMCSLTHWASCSVGWLPIIINYVNVSITLIDLRYLFFWTEAQRRALHLSWRLTSFLAPSTICSRALSRSWLILSLPSQYDFRLITTPPLEGSQGFECARWSVREMVVGVRFSKLTTFGSLIEIDRRTSNQPDGQADIHVLNLPCAALSAMEWTTRNMKEQTIVDVSSRRLILTEWGGNVSRPNLLKFRVTLTISI